MTSLPLLARLRKLWCGAFVRSSEKIVLQNVWKNLPLLDDLTWMKFASSAQSFPTTLRSLQLGSPRVSPLSLDEFKHAVNVATHCCHRLATLNVSIVSLNFPTKPIAASLREFANFTKLFDVTLTCYTQNQTSIDADEILELKNVVLHCRYIKLKEISIQFHSKKIIITTTISRRNGTSMWEHLTICIRAKVNEATTKFVICDRF